MGVRSMLCDEPTYKVWQKKNTLYLFPLKAVSDFPASQEWEAGEECVKWIRLISWKKRNAI